MRNYNDAGLNYDNRYHKEVYGFPDSLDIPTGEFPVEPTDHAIDEANNTNKSDVDSITIPDSIEVEEEKVFEVYTRNGHVVRLCSRTLYDGKYALCFTLDFEQQNNLVTVWLNRYDDIHSTLDSSLYDKP